MLHASAISSARVAREKSLLALRAASESALEDAFSLDNLHESHTTRLIVPVLGSNEIAMRAMTQRDVEACVEVLMGYPWTRYAMTRERARNALMSGLEQMGTGVSQLHVAAPDGAVEGFVWWMPRGAFYHSGYIRLIGRSPSAQRRGIGRALMREAEEAVIAESRDMLLLVSDFNIEAQAFYQHLGYAHVGALPDYVAPGISELLMHKRLR